MKLKKEYDAAWGNARQHFFDNNLFLDPHLLDVQNDTRVGLAALIQLEGSILHKFSEVISEFENIESLASMRNKIRTQAVREGVKLLERGGGNFVHSCFVRFKNKLHNPEKVIQFVDQFRDFELGEFHISKISLVFNNWYNRQEASKPIGFYFL